MVTTALALSSVKSSPSLTLPLHTAINKAPSETRGEETVSLIQTNILLVHAHKINLSSKVTKYKKHICLHYYKLKCNVIIGISNKNT